jgi:putative phosphoesterase
MRYALISDIHANLPALQAVLADISQQSDVDATYHLGDLVGYAPWPNEVVTLLHSAHIAGVAGNYDSTTATDYKHCGCKYEDPQQEALAHLSYEWTRANVTHETKRWLESLPFRIDLRPLGGHIAGPQVILLHGNQILNTVYVTADRSDTFLRKMGAVLAAKRGDVICFGHTHTPWHRVIDGIHFVNTGSVGRPKDGDWRAGYVLLDIGTVPDAGALPLDGLGDPRVTFVRVPYDIDAAVRGIHESTLPHEFAEYLRHGGQVPHETHGTL